MVCVPLHKCAGYSALVMWIMVFLSASEADAFPHIGKKPVVTSLQKTTTTEPDDPAPTPSTLVDILSAQVQFSSFLRVLQRNGLIPVLNSLQNVTLLAPVNSAFTMEPQQFDESALLRYIIDQRFRVGYMGREPVVFDTLYEPHNKSYNVFVSPNFESLEYEIDKTASIVEYDIYAKHQWSFVQAIDNQLPLKRTMCQTLLDDNNELQGHQISFIKGLFKSLFESSSNLHTDKKKQKKKYNIIPTSCEVFLQNVSTIFIPTDDMIHHSMSNITSRYFSALYHVISSDRFSTTEDAILEIKYDITNLLTSLLMEEPVAPGNTSVDVIKSIHGHVEYNVSGYEDSIILNDEIQSFPNTTTSLADGIIHIFDSSINPEISFFETLGIPVPEINPRKALFALHYSDFVKELKFRSLDSFIDGSVSNQTFFLSMEQRDDYIEDSSEGRLRKRDTISPKSFSTKSKLMYQIASEAVNVTDELLRDPSADVYKLLDTAMCSKSKVNGCYRLKLSSSMDENNVIESRLNDDNVLIAGPFDFGMGNIGYIVHNDIDTPSSFKHTLADLLSNGGIPRHLEHISINQDECLKTIRYLKEFDLMSFKDNHRGYSAFLPCGITTKGSESNTQDTGHSWENLGLILTYLENNPKTFKKILEGIFVEDLIYSDFGLSGGKQSVESRTLKGDILNIHNEYFDGDFNHLLSINGSFVAIPLNSDLLFNQGVIHVVDKLFLPSSFEVALLDLIRATEDDQDSVSFLDLIETFPKLNELLKLDTIDESPFSLLIPTQESLNLHNITITFTNLLELLETHLIPNSELEKIFGCIYETQSFEPAETGTAVPPERQILTNSSKAALVCRKSSKGKLIFDVNTGTGENTGHKIKVLRHGCTTVNTHNTSKPCVFLIDKPIDPKWFEENDGFLHIHLGFLSIAVGVILGLVIFSILIFLLMFWLSDRNSSANKPPFTPYEEGGYMDIGADVEDNNPMFDGGYETDDDMLGERDHLLPDRKRRAPNYGSGENSGSQPAQPVFIRGSRGSKLNRSRNLPEI